MSNALIWCLAIRVGDKCMVQELNVVTDKQQESTLRQFFVMQVSETTHGDQITIR